MKKDFFNIIKNNTNSWSDFTTDFGEDEKKTSENEIRYYDVLQNLKAARKQLGLTQAQVADKANLPRTTISKVESGKYNPTVSTLMSIANALNKTLRISVV